MPEYNNISKTKDLTQKQSQNVITTSYEAEDVLKDRKSLSLEAPAKSEKKKETKKARTDDLVNPVARKELRRRQTNKMKTGLEHTQFDLVIRDLGREHIVSEDVQMEKGWIRAQMKMLEKDADKRKLEEIRKERLALEELKREKQKKFDEAHNTQAHSARISGFMDRADTAVRSLLSGKRNRISCMPKDSLLTTEYGRKFKERISSKTRDKKSKNKRSRLYLKRVLFDQVREAESSYKAGCYTQIRDLMMNRVCDDEDYSDLSHFMIPGEAALNRSLLNLYLGKDRSKEGEGGFAGQDIQTALDKMLRQIFTTDLTQFNFESDSAMMKNSAALEHLLGQIGAFDRMAEKHDYFNTLDDETKHRVNDRLGALRSIANYYQIRKQILTNQYYMTHYNDEMTMDIIWDRSDPKSEIGELLLKAQVLGRTMMRLNGMDKKKLAKYKEPSFSDENKAGVYRDLERELMSDKGQKDLLANAYRTERIFNDENRRKITLPETEKDIKLKEEFDKSKRARRVEPKRKYFFRTGVWKNDATKEEADRAKPTEKKWLLYDYISDFEDQAYSLEYKDDEAYVKEITTLNDNILNNMKKIETMDARDLRHAFVSGFWDAHKNPSDDPEVEDNRNYEIEGSDICHRVENLVKLRLKPVDDFIRNIYKKRMKGGLWCVDKNAVSTDDGNIFLSLRKLAETQEDADELNPIIQWANNYYVINKELQLDSLMDENIFQSKAIQALIFGEVSFENKEYQIIKRRMKDNEEFLTEMINEKYDYAGSGILYGMRRFMGEKYLFADYRTIVDLAERYMRTAAMLNPEATKLERDYKYAYSSAMKESVFGGKLRKGAALFLGRSGRFTDRTGYGAQNQETGRVGRFKNRLSMIKEFDKILADHTGDLKLTRQGWDKLMYYCDFIMENALSREATPDGKQDLKKLREDMEKYITNAIRSVHRLVEDKNQGIEVPISRDEFLDVKPPQAKEKSKKAIRKITVIHKDDYTFAGLLRGKGLVYNPEIVKYIPDEKIREFLADNISNVILLNPDLKEIFPYLKDIRNLDQMEKLSVIEFKQVLRYLTDNLIEGELGTTVKKLLFDTDKAKETKEQEHIRKYTLLEMLKHRTTVKGVSDIIRKVQTDYHSMEAIKLKRAQIALARDAKVSDGKIHYHFEDMPDMEKAYWKKNSWFVDRIDHFDRAHNVWQNLEKLAPSAAEQVREWIRDIVNSGDQKEMEKRFDQLAEMLQFDYQAWEKKAEEAKKAGKKEPAKPKFAFKVNNPLAMRFRSFETDGKDLLNEIRKVFVTGQQNVEPGTEKPLKIKNFILEMAMFDTQGIVLSHGGRGQQLLWADKGERSSEAYKKALLLQARDSIEKMDMLDEALKKYEGNKELKKKLREKLAPVVLSMAGSEFAKKSTEDEQIVTLREKIENCDEMIRKYKEAREVYNKFKKQAQEQVLAKDKTLPEKSEKDYIKAVQRSLEGIPGASEAQSLARSLEEVYKTAEKEKKEAESTLKTLMDSATTVSSDYMDEMQENMGTLGIENFSGIERMLIGHVRENGELSNELCDNVALYEKRKKTATEYGNGELAPLWDELLKNDEVFRDVTDPADTVAEAKIRELYEFFAPLGAASFEQYSYVSEFFIADNVQKLLDKKDPATKKIVSELSGKDFEQQRKYWSGKLLEFHNEIITRTKKGTGSVKENMLLAQSSLRDYLTRHFLYDSPDFKEDVEGQNAVMKTGLFAEAENLEKLASQHKQTLTQLAQHKADAILNQIETYVLENSDLIEQAYEVETLKRLYRDLSSHFVENVDHAEEAFARYILSTEKGVDVSGLDQKDLRSYIDKMDQSEKDALKNRTYTFVAHVNSQAISNTTTDFSKKLDGWVKNFVDETKKALESDVTFTEEYREGARARAEARRKAALDVRLTKNTGKTTYDKLLFAGKLSKLKQFGDVRQPLVYGDESRRENIISRGAEEDKKLFDAAKEFFKKKEDTDREYPDILADCLDEYVRMQNSAYTKADQFISWMIREDSDAAIEAKRLKKICDYARDVAQIPDAAMDLYMTYAARFADRKNVTEVGLKGLTAEFMSYYEILRKLETSAPKHPVLRAAHEDAVEKMKAYLFVEEEKSSATLAEFRDLVDNQITFFDHARICFPMIERIVATDGYTGKLDKVYQLRYTNSLYEYFLGQITEDALKAVSGEKQFDKKTFEKQVKERIADSAERETLIMEKDSLSSLDLQKRAMLPGTVGQEDFEKHLIDNMSRDDLADYNKLDDEQKKLFALSLYIVNKEERGTMRAIYGKDPEAIKAQRDLILRYMKGEEVSFRVDYGRAMRALTARGKGYKLVADEKLFDQAFTFVKQIEKQKDELMPKDYDRLSDSEANAKAADKYRQDLGKENALFTTQMNCINNIEVYDRNSFLRTLEDYSFTDQQRREKVAGSIVKIMGRVADLTVSQQNLLMYVLQDRTVLDYSSRGKNASNIVPFVNEKKRFDLYERMLTEEGRLDVMEKTSDPEMLERSMKSLMSFQLKDDRELGETLTKDDFVQSSLNRRYVIDWALLSRAVDFVHEIENERIRLVAVRQAGELVLNDEEKSKNAAHRFYHLHKHNLTNINEVSQSERMDMIIGDAFKEDKDLITGTSLDNGDTLDDLLTGYNALTSAQKRLFFRALEHREILDVSQKNLYRNLFGLAERDFVDPKGRDKLIDEFISKGDDVDTNIFTYERALISLCSTQINDDMDFLKMNGLNAVGENFTVTNQWFVSDRGTLFGRTAFDWKLFQRALQFVTRATNEKQVTAGNAELYRALGDTEKNGKMKIDTTFMRVNLHHTGSRFMRFLAKEGYGKAVNQASGIIGLFDSAADYTDYILSTKTSNYIYGKLNQAINRDVIEKKEEEDNDEPVKLQEVLKETEDEIREAAGKVQEANSKIVEIEIKISDLNLHKGIQKDDANKVKALEKSIEQAKKDLEDAKADKAELEHEHNQLRRKRDRTERAIARETLEENNNIAKICEMVSSIKEQEEKIKETAKQVKEGYDSVKEMFGFKKEEEEEEVLDALEQQVKDVKVEERKKSLTGNPKLDNIIGVIKMTPTIKKTLDSQLIGNQEMLETVDKYAQAIIKTSIGAQTVGESYDKAELWTADKIAEIQNLAIPKELKDIIDNSLETVIKSKDFIDNISSYVSDGVEILGHFRDIVNASKNIVSLNRANAKADDVKAEDDAAIDAVSETKFNVKLIKQAADNNLAFVKGGKSITKSIEGRKILASAGELAKKASSYADVNGIDEIIDTAVHLADFFWKCMADNKSIVNYYGSAGNAELHKLDVGLYKTKNGLYGDWLNKGTKLKTDEKGQYVVTSRAFNMLRTAQGFERNEELSDYLKLNMVYSLMFSSSVYNPMKASRILAECTMTVLGFEDLIGKTDSDTALKIFNGLKK